MRGQGGILGGGGYSGIKSIQRGSIILNGVTSNTGTITAVVLANSILRFMGVSSQDAGQNSDRAYASVEFTNTTTITARKTTTTGITTVYFEVIEYEAGIIKSNQGGDGSFTVAGTGTKTITSVDVNKSIVSILGYRYPAATGYVNSSSNVGVILTNATTVTTTTGDGTFLDSVYFQVVEFN